MKIVTVQVICIFYYILLHHKISEPIRFHRLDFWIGGTVTVSLYLSVSIKLFISLVSVCLIDLYV